MKFLNNYKVVRNTIAIMKLSHPAVIILPETKEESLV
jgi:hypothetical protein